MSADRLEPRPAALDWWGPGVTMGPRCSKGIGAAVDWLAYWGARLARGVVDAADTIAAVQRDGERGIGTLAPLYTDEGRAYLAWCDVRPEGETYPARYPQYFRSTEVPS